MELLAIRKPIFTIDVPTIGRISCRTCTVADHRKICVMRDLRSILERVTVEDIPKTLKTIDIMWAKLYLNEIEQYTRDNMDVLAVPSCGEAEDDAEKSLLKIHTVVDKLVADYAHLSFIEIQDIDIIDYRLIAADAYKHMVMTNKPDAVEYLNECYCNMHEICSMNKIKPGGNTEIMISEG